MEHSSGLPHEAHLNLSNYIKPGENRGRENLGAELPVIIYRLLEYSFQDELTARFGPEEQIRIFRGAGFRAGTCFAEQFLDLNLEFSDFISQLQQKLEEFKIGVLRIEETEEDTGRMVLTLSEDADCSGLPMLGKTVCNYDEGFLAGLLTAYTKKPYRAVEVNCWATGDRVCRFRAEAEEQ